eukprot:399539-Pyramimonas_sp.AAC.1
MILDGVSLHRQLKHRQVDVFHYSASHPDYTLNNGSRFQNVIAAELCADYMIKTAKLAVLFFCQPSRGSAVWDGRIKCATSEDGYAEQEAKVQDLAMYWQDWSPEEGKIPKSIFGALPFREPLAD